MRIHDTSGQAPGSSRQFEQPGRAEDGQGHLSMLAGSIAALSCGSPERAAKVAKLARLYRAGQCAVDAESLGSALIDNATRIRTD